MIIKILLIALFILIVPWLVGMLYMDDSFLKAYTKGFITLMAIFQMLAVPFVFLELSLTRLLQVYGVVVVLLCVIALALTFGRIPGMFAGAWKAVTKTPWQIYAAILLIVGQVYALEGYYHIDNDDAFFVATAVTAVETDTLYQVDAYTGEDYEEMPSRYVLAPFPLFIALVSVVVSLHPTILAHAVFPAILIPFTYMIYAIIGQFFFRDNKKMQGYFLIFLSLLHIFSGYSIYTPGIFLLTRIWQGKAILAAALLPAAFGFAWQAVADKDRKQNWVLLLMTMFACCMVSSMGVLLGAITLGIAVVVSAVVYRRPLTVLYGIACSVPNLIYAGVYLLIR